MSFDDSKLSQTTEVIIVGAGLVGRLLAIGLSQKGIKVVSIDQTVFNREEKAQKDGRTTSISFGSRLIFEDFGIWHLIAPFAQPICNIKVVESGEPFVLEYDAEDLSHNPMGYIVENKHIFEALFNEELEQQLIAQDLLEIIAPATVKEISYLSQKVQLTLSNDRVLEGDLLIAADGRNSPLRAQTPITILQKEYDQKALVMHIAHEKPHHDTAFEVFFKDGPLAVLPMRQQISQTPEGIEKVVHRSGVVWCKKREFAFETQTDEELMKEFFHVFPYLGKAELMSQKWIYNLSAFKVSSLIHKRFALIGDAGHAMHPIAGQGVNLGWRDVKDMVAILTTAKAQGQDLGDPLVLKRYERARKVDRLSLFWATDKINLLYGLECMPIKMARNFAFFALNYIKPLKRTIMKRAMGLL